MSQAQARPACYPTRPQARMLLTVVSLFIAFTAVLQLVQSASRQSAVVQDVEIGDSLVRFHISDVEVQQSETDVVVPDPLHSIHTEPLDGVLSEIKVQQAEMVADEDTRQEAEFIPEPVHVKVVPEREEAKVAAQAAIPGIVTEPALSDAERFERIRARRHVFVEEINGNDAATIVRQANTTYSLFRMPQLDYDEGVAFYSELQDVVVSGKSLKAYDGDRVYFPGGCDLYPDPFPLEKMQTTVAADVIYLDHVLVVSQYWGQEYYHWMIEGFPRVALMLDYIHSHPSMKLLVSPHAVAAPLFNLIDIVAERLVWYDQSKVYFARMATCPSPSHCGKGIAPALRRLRALLRTKIALKLSNQVATPVPKPFTIVVQARVGSRMLVNHSDLVRMLRAAHPDTTVIEYGPAEGIMDAISKHYNADIVIGPHGAGLSNVIFAPDGATLIELHPNIGNQADEGPHHVNGCHQRTAKRSGLHAILFLEDNGSGGAFSANINRVVDAVTMIRAGHRGAIESYHSWQV